MASPMVPGEDPSEFEMDGRTGARILISTDTRKERTKRSARGLMGRYTFLCLFHCEEYGGSSLLRDENKRTYRQIPGRRFRVDGRSSTGSIAESRPHVKEVGNN